MGGGEGVSLEARRGRDKVVAVSRGLNDLGPLVRQVDEVFHVSHVAVAPVVGEELEHDVLLHPTHVMGT